MNHQIRIREVRLIDQDGNQVGVVPTSDALRMAQEKGLDLVEVAPDSWPPVCRILDFGKYKYEQSKRERKARKKQHSVQMKEVRLRPKTDRHDLKIKADHAREFLEEGARVQVTVLFRGREMVRQDLGRKVLQDFLGVLSDVAKVESEGRMEGRRLTAMIMRKPGLPKPPPKGAAKAASTKADDAKASVAPSPVPAETADAPEAAESSREERSESPTAIRQPGTSS